MEISLFSIVWILLVFRIFIKNKYFSDLFTQMLSLGIALELCIDIGYFIKIKDFNIGYGEITMICLFMLCMAKGIHKLNLDRKLVISVFIIIISVVIGLFLALIVPYKGMVFSNENYWDRFYFWGAVPEPLSIGANSIKELMHLLIFLVILLSFFSNRFISKEKLVNMTFKFFKPFIIIGLLEVVAVSILGMGNVYKSVLIKIFGDAYINTTSVIGNRLCGLKSEPSFYAYALMLMFLTICVSNDASKKKKHIWLSIISLELFMSRSFSMIICVLFLVATYYFHIYSTGKQSKRTKFWLWAFIGVFFGAAVLFVTVSSGILGENYILSRIMSFGKVISNLDINGWEGDQAFLLIDSSSRIRLISIIECFKQCLHRPLFGLGLGTNYTHGSLPTVLSQIGLIATFFSYRILFFTLKPTNKYYRLNILVWLGCQVFITNGMFSLYGLQNILLVILLRNICQVDKIGLEVEIKI